MRHFLQLATVLLCLAFLTGLAAPTAEAQQSGPVYSGNFDKATKSGTDKVTIRFKEDGVNKQLVVNVDINKGDSAQTVANKVRDAINDAADPDNPEMTQDDITAQSIGDTVQIVGTGGDTIESTKYKSESGQKKNTFKKISDGDVLRVDLSQGAEKMFTAVPIGPVRPAQPRLLPQATVRYTGSIFGVDDDGNPATVTVGTAFAEIVRSTSDFVTIEEMIDALVADLRAAGISATKVSSSKLRIRLRNGDGNEIVYGSDDAGLTVITDFLP